MEYFFQDIFQQLIPPFIVGLFVALMWWKFVIKPYFIEKEEDE